MPSILPRLLEITQYALDTLPHHPRVTIRLISQRGQNPRDPRRRRRAIRKRLDQRPETQHRSVARADDLRVFRRRGVGARASRGQRCAAAAVAKAGSDSDLLGQGRIEEHFGEFAVQVLDDAGAERDRRAADHAGEGGGRAEADFELDVFEHGGYALEEVALLFGGDEEEAAEVDDLHVYHGAQALVPRRGGSADFDERFDEGDFFADAVGDVGEVPENLVG